jgi:hypothetical protein
MYLLFYICLACCFTPMDVHGLLLQMREAGVDGLRSAETAAAGVMQGLRSLFVYSNTGGGRAAMRAHDGVRQIVHATMRDRRRLLTATQQAELEGFAADSKVRMPSDCDLTLEVWQQLPGQEF